MGSKSFHHSYEMDPEKRRKQILGSWIWNMNLSWIEKTFYKRDCVCMIPSSREPHRCIPGCQICHQLVRCCCGRLIKEHSFYRSNAGGNPSGDLPGTGSEVWTAENHTVKSSTDAYGTIDFQGGSQTSKAKYVRLSSDSKVEDVLHLMVKEWRMQLPKLVISVHGGKQRFDLHPHIKEALSRGLVKVATTTGSWIFTGGVDNGVAEHIGDALKENSSYLNQKVCTVGIAPWGVVEGRQDLVGRNIVVPYQALLTPLSKLHVLNSLHSHFILVDDGTVGRHGAEVPLRKNLESSICLQQIHSRTGKRIPIVALILEGGPGTILTVFEYLQQSPPVPVVVCEGSGRAADLLAYVYKHTENQGNLLEGSEADVIATIKNSFNLSQGETAHMFQTLLACMKTKYLITVYRAGPEEQQDIDVAILTSLLKSTNVSPYDQLVLALAWDREDIAKDFIFVQGRQWLTKPLEQIMLDALVMNRVAFVKLLIEKGVSMHRFLTIPRLEELYNAAQYTSKDTLLQLIQDVKKGNLPATYKITLLDVGLVIEYLMGGTYRCNYTKRNFRTMYKKLNQSLGQSDQGSSSKSDDSLGRIDRKEKTRHGHFLQTAKPFGSKNDTSEKEKVPRSGIVYREDDIGKPFHYPYNELLVWAVLMKRQKMALFFWQHGEESMAKALVARCLFRAMSWEAKKWDIIDDTPDKLKEYSKEFGDLAVELLDKAYQSNEIKTMKILTYELRNWSKSTCLKLAVSGKLQTFVSHECTQKLLTEIWMGRLSLRKNSWLKVILGIFLPPVIPFFNYKTKAQMSHIPLSEGAHQMIQSERDDIKYTEEGITLGACKERAFHDGSGENHAETRIEGKYKRLPLAQKYFAFYHAPIVKFWFNTLVYLAFLMLYTYVVLVKMESLPSVQEWIVIITIVTTGVETMREIFVSEAGKISQKLKTHFSSYLNINEFLGILTFLIGFGLRFGSRNIPDSTSDVDFVFESGRIIYCLNTIFWFVRLLDLLNVNQDAGLYVFIMAKMVSKMFFIVVIMGIVVIAFGVPKQGILHPHEEPSIALAQAVVFRPYWMMYGEMFAYEIDPCSNDSVVPHLCVTGSWLNGYLQAVYVFVQYIIMVNLLIAIFNNVYAECKAMSNHLWKFQRYFVIMFYQGKPVLPPPFVLFSHITTVITWLCRGRPKTKSQGPKLFLTEEDQIRLHEFEGQCVQIYFNDKKDHESSKSDERIRVTTERVEDMLGDVKDVRDHVGFIKQLLHHLDDHIGHLQDLSGLTLDSMKTLTAQKALEMNRSHSIMSSDISRSQQTTDDGLGHSVMWRKSRSDQVWSRSLSHPALDTIIHPKASISLRRINSSDTSPTHSSLFLSSDDHNHDEKFDDLEFQKRAFSEHKVGYSQPKSLKIHNSSVAMIHSPQTLPKLRVTPKLKDSLQSQNVQLHTFSVFTDSACSVDQGNTLKEGVVNLAFIDDRGNAIHKHDVDHVGSDFKISDEESTKKDGQLSSEMSPAGGSDCPHDNIHESTVKPPSKSEQLSNSSTITEMFQKLWTKSKHSGFKLYKTKQLSEDTESTYSNEDGLRRTSSCTDLNGFQPTSPSTSNSQFNMDSKSMSYEDLYQIDSKAALLKEPYYSRYSSAPKSSLQKKTFTRFGHDFKTSMEKSFYYSAIERNNLYRLSQSIPFTPLPPVGELATVYRLEESSPNILNNSMSSWSHNGYYSTIEILTKEEMGGGLRRAVKVACTWSENDILKAGHLYIIKSFLPEVVNNWSGVYKDGTVLQLCLREIQQQRAAQKLLFAFNQMKPKAIPYTPKFLEVFLLYCHSVGQWFTIEECMAGRFRKYNNNTGNETVPSNKLEKTMLAFSHWTYEYSRGEFLVLDLQGVGENLTDPSVIKAGERRSNDMVFGPANLGDDAIKYFCANHQCNSCCKHLKLPEIKRNDYVVDEALLRGSALLVSESHGTERPIQQPLREDQQC